MVTGSNSSALSAGPSLFDYVSFIWKINVMGIPLEIPYDVTGTDYGLEHRMVYWREDPGTNLYHWHWHIVYPFSGPDTYKMDRRGELFYYLHNQILARYNVERLCNRMNVVQPLANWDEPIPEPYYPILNSYIASKNYPGRKANMKLSNVNRKDLGLKIKIKNLRLYKERILEAIRRRKVLAANGTEIPIDNERGIDILGNVVEASNLSPNPRYYGSIHNDGHVVISVVNDPEYKNNQSAGVMFRSNTALRDPLFYRWHSFIHSFFVEYKASLPTYDEKILSFPGIKVTNVELTSYQNGKYKDEKNTLYTYMVKSDVNMSAGLDFTKNDPVFVRLAHQNHDEFNYTIEYVNNFSKNLLGTVRIFLLPVIGHDNSPMKLAEQRSMAIEMDKFVHPLKPGINRIVRSSTLSSATIPFEQTYRNLDDAPPNICGCGWPHYLLVPRGTAKGYPMLLFAMITDANADRVNPIRDINPPPNACKPSESVCGLKGEKYPDKRPAGFPFDRPVKYGVDTIDDFLTPNMAIKPITIFHLDEVRPGRLLTDATPMILEKGNFKYIDE